MAKDDIDLDDMDFEDFDFGFDDDFGTDDTPDRTPGRTAVKALGRSVGDSLVSKQSLLRTSKQVLPDSYGQAVGLAEEAKEGLTSIYNDAKDELTKSKSVFRGIAKQVDKAIGKQLPSILSDKLREFAEQEEDSYQWGPQSNAESIAAELAGVFGEQMDHAAREGEITRQEQRISTNMLVRQGQSAAAYAQLTADGVSRLVAYQDTVGNKFQRKALELQYKQFFLQKELVERSAEYFGKQLAFSKTIEKNTGLPDAVKLRQSELLAHTIKQRMIGSTLNKVSEFASDFTGRLGKNVKDWAGGVVGGIAQGAEFYEMTESMMDGLPEAERREFMMQQAGGLIGERIRERMADAAKPWVDKHMPERAKAMFHRLGTFTNDPYAAMSEYGRSSTTRGGILGRAEEFLKQFIPTHYRDEAVGSGNVFTDASEVAYFDNLSHRSITQIIPEHLSQVVRWTKAIYTGKDDGELGRQVYDFSTGKMGTKADSIANVKNMLFGQNTHYDRQDLDDLVNDLTGGAKLSPEASSLLRRQLLEDASRNVVFRPETWARYDKYLVQGTPAAIDELVGFFRARYNVDAEGKMADPNEEMRESIDETRNRFVSFKNRVAIPTEHIAAIGSTYGNDALERLGLVDSKGKLSYDRIWDFILNENVGGIGEDSKATMGGLIRPGQSGDDQFDFRTAMQQMTEAVNKQAQIQSQANDANTNASSTTGGEWDQYLGLSSPLYTLTDAVRASAVQSQDHLQSIMTILMTTNLETGQGAGVSPGRVTKWLRDRAQQGIGMTKEYFRFWGRQYRKAGGLLKEVVPKVVGTAWSTGKSLLGIRAEGEIGDVYVKGRLRPVLLARDIKAGLYRDRKTDKVIESIDDIHGDVIDVDGNVVLTQEDYDAGLTDHQGKAIVFKGWDLTKSYFSTAFGLYGKAFGIARDIGAKLWTAAKEYKDKIDLYVKDNMSEPILAYHKLRNGEYFDKDGNVYTKWSEIKDRVYDSQGRLVASMEDIRERGGFVDVSGKAVKSFFSGKGTMIMDMVKGGVSMYGKYLGALGKGVRAIGRGIRGIGRGILNGIGGGGGGRSEDFEYEMTFFAQEQTVLQENILEQLKILVSRGEGPRKGSAEEIRARRAAGRGEKDSKDGAKGDGKDNRGILGKTVDAAKDFVSDKTSMLMGAVGGAIGSAAMATAGAIGSGIMAVGGAALSGVMAVGSTLAAAVSLPALAVGAAVAATLYGGYKLYERYTRADVKILELRMAQYGVHFSDKDEVAKVLSAEELLLPYLKVDHTKGTGRIMCPDSVVKEFMEIMDVKMSKEEDADRTAHIQRIGHWLKTRFQTVLAAHEIARQTYCIGIDLPDLDEKITGEEALSYLEAVKCDDLHASGAFDDMTAPFKDGWVFDAKLTENSKDVNSFYKTAVKFYTKRMEKEGVSEENIVDSPVKDEDSLLIENAKKLAMITPMGLAVKASKSLFDKVSDSSMVSSLMTGLSSLGSMARGLLSDAKDAVVSAVVPDFVRDGWNRLTESKPELLELVRFMTYGLVEVDGAKVQLLRRLEAVVSRHMSTDGTFTGDPEQIYTAFAGRFKINGDGTSSGALMWKSWFMNRFLPVITLTKRVAKQYSPAALEDLDKALSDVQRLDVATDIIEAVYRLRGGTEDLSVWGVDTPPWPGYILNSDKSSTAPVIARLQEAADGKSKGVFSSIGGFLSGMVDSALGRKAEDAPDGSTGGQPNTDTRMGAPQQWSQGATAAPGLHKGGVGSSMGGSAVTGFGAGTGGKMDQIPIPRGSGWETSKDTIIAAAKMVGIDPALAATIAGQESGWNPSARASTSTAKGYFQFLDGTWKEMMGKYAKKYGIPRGTTALNPRANALLGAEFLKEGYDNVKRALSGQREPTDVDVYLNHFLGPGGVRTFLKADPNASATKVMPKAAKSNPSIFREGNRERTVAEVYQYMDLLLNKRREFHGMSPQSEGALRPMETPVIEAAGGGVGSHPMGSGANVGDGSKYPSWMTEGLEGGYSETIETTIGYTDASGNRGSVTSSVTRSTPNYPTGGGGGEMSSGGSTTLSTGPVGSMEAATAKAGQVEKLTLQREASTDSGTYGKLTLPSGASFITLELGWRNNKPRSSCIPAGTYVVKIKTGGKYKRAYRLEDVPGRSEILIHAGNRAGNTERGEKSDVLGCILLGTAKMKFGNQPGIINSKVAMEQFMSLMGGRDFILTILDGGVQQATLDKELPKPASSELALPASGASSNTTSPSMSYSEPSYDAPVQNAPVQYHQEAARVADTQSRSRDLPVGSQLKATEDLLVIGNSIATQQLETLRSIHEIVQSLATKAIPVDPTDPAVKESPAVKKPRGSSPTPVTTTSFRRESYVT